MLTDKEKIIFNKGLDIYKEEKTKSLDIANKRIEKELNISIKEYNEIQNYVINLIKEHEKYDSLMYISLLMGLTMFAIQKYNGEYGYIINLIVLIIQAIVIYKFINAKKRNKDIREELEDIYTMEEKWNI